jgi:hypothetical protein
MGFFGIMPDLPARSFAWRKSMKRMALLILSVAIMLTGSPGLSAAPAAAQAAAPSPIPAQPLATPLDQLTLRVEEGNGYTMLVDSDGQPQKAELHQVQNGVYPEDMNPAVIDRYTHYNTQDVYITAINLVPPGAEALTATSVEMRLATFSDADSAAGFVSTFVDEFPGQAEALGTNPEVTGFEILWDREGTIAGFDAFEIYYDVVTGEPLFEVPYTRILVQSGPAVASAKVGGQSSELNLAIALELVIAQVACIDADVPCEAIPLPIEFPNSPSVDAALADTGSMTATVIVANANIRATPSATGEIVGVAPSGQVLTVTGGAVESEGYTWLPVTLENGVAGWVADELVQLTSD